MYLGVGLGVSAPSLSGLAVDPVGKALEAHKPGVASSFAPRSSAVPGSKGKVQIPFWHYLWDQVK